MLLLKDQRSSPCGGDSFNLNDELRAMLQFFHGLNAVLWYDSAELRNLVVLDPQWIIDAVCAFIRDFQHRDHSAGYDKMAKYDQEAIRKEREAWEMLTEGRATLQRKLLNILWSSADFKEHRAELIDLAQRFGLMIPVPKRSDEWLIPALLRDKPSAQTPSGWPWYPNEGSTPECAARR